MSKKKKGTLVGTKPPAILTTPSTPKETLAVAAPPSSSLPENHRLIHFDKRVKWFLLTCLGLFVFLTLLKINYSSVAMWNQVIPDGSDLKKGVWAGTPRQIRMDDYAGATPGYLSQVLNGFPLENPAIGGERMPLMGWPTKHISMIFRPSLWGFLAFGMETGFSWYWNFKVFGLLAAGLLFFLLLTRNSFWLSVLGAFWLLLSSSTQWWMSVGVPEMITFACLMFVAAIYWLFSRKPIPIFAAALGLTYSLACYVLLFYPPYQVPLAYLILFAGIGYLINHAKNKDLLSQIPIKLVAIAGALVCVGAGLYAFYTDAKSTLDVITNTAYPGQRRELGGTGFVSNWFSEYYGWQLDERKLPKEWLNICEASHSLTFTPVIFLSLVYLFYKQKTVDFVQIGLLAFLAFTLIWIEFGFPETLGKLTLMSMSPTRRTQVPFGVGNVVLAVTYVGYLRSRSVEKDLVPMLVLGLAAVAVMIYAASLNVTNSNGFFKTYQLILPTIFFLALNIVLLPQVSPVIRNWVFGLGIALFLLHNFSVNPIAVGLSPITDHSLYKAIREISQKEPKARWLVNGSQYIGYLTQAAGVNVLGGVKQTPDFKTMRVLDPSGKRDTVYNRYAHTVFYSYIDGRDTVIMNNQFYDGYNVGLDPCSPKLKALNVKYVIFDHAPQAPEIRCMKPVTTLGSISIYRRDD
ncbi:DUF7657 domain-containing protein [Tellurirhabdus bombi]|uniref:DUF7657 domain-containing protein n=1 Tax=Tellurirhabdus bombi TaxID=2907205 RepID=UPI001F1888C8|nr:hypothetical protein [Tellurirhabdus bombi]